VAVVVVAAAIAGVVAFVSTLGSSEPSSAPTDTTDAAPIELSPPSAIGNEDEPELPTPPTPPSVVGSSPITEGTFAMPEFGGVVVPTFPTIDAEPGQDLDRAVGRLGDDAAVRSTTRVALGVGGWVREYTMLRDPVNDRYEVIGSADGIPTDRFVVDIATETTYYSVGADDWATISNRPDADQIGVADIGVLLDRLILGPLRTDTFDRAEIEPAGSVTIDTERAHAFVVAMPGAAIPEWQLYFFGPVGEFDPTDRPTSLVYDVYVTADGRLSRVIGVADVGGVAQLVDHRIEVLVPPIEIELPPTDGGR
jgi:hypothetical protein